MLFSVFSESGFVKYALSPKGSRACLAERFSAKNGDPPEAGKFWENQFFTGKMDHWGQKNAQVDDTICQGPRRTCQNFFSFTIVAVGVTFLKVILKLSKNVLNGFLQDPSFIFLSIVLLSHGDIVERYFATINGGKWWQNKRNFDQNFVHCHCIF